jgi:hypothetical protein
MKVARYEVPGSHKKQAPSRRERYDWLSRRWRGPLKSGFSPRPHILPSPNCKSGSLTHQTVPSGTAHQLPLFQALRTWTSASSVESLPSFSPFGTTKRQYLSTFSKPHRSVGVPGQVRIAALGGWDAERVPMVLKTISDSLAVRGSSIPTLPVRLEDWRRRSQRSGLVEPEH